MAAGLFIYKEQIERLMSYSQRRRYKIVEKLLTWSITGDKTYTGDITADTYLDQFYCTGSRGSRGGQYGNRNAVRELNIGETNKNELSNIYIYNKNKNKNETKTKNEQQSDIRPLLPFLNGMSVEEKRGYLRDDIDRFSSKYAKDVRNAFLAYWGQTDTKCGTKLRCELQDAWDTGARLRSWIEKGRSISL